MLATILGAVAANFIPIPQLTTSPVRTVNDVAALALFLLTGAIISGLTESLHRVHRRILANERRRADVSGQRWRNLTEALPQLVWSAAPDGACDYFSTQWTEHTGVAEADLLGWRWLQTL